MPSVSRQRIRYLRTRDGVQLAWAEAGAGPLLVKASNWLTHLEYDWESPVWRHWIRFFADHFRFVRYDERGCGMTRLERRRPLVRALGRGPGAVVDRGRPRTSRSRCSASRRGPRRASPTPCAIPSASRA